MPLIPRSFGSLCVCLEEESKESRAARLPRKCSPKKTAADPQAVKRVRVEQECIKAACMVSLLYDIAGRSEDAFNLTWERIEYSKDGGGCAHLVKGKTTSREVIFSPKTEQLLREHASSSAPDGPVFDFNSANAMIKWLDRFVKRITLPAENKI